ncbi:Rrf2 family transcriptional regulator [Niveispirillum lacus]|uniref:Rrf2 family transcriptional regulator n=1 Tax=Niveispirillum lacus TaxID=1981099 RepID=A0A255YX85_9PROT|nr:Rrf2 family transcriptional regulator [Niveispirillum lacus]OYQ33822.1 Rrf2 family transcriptional regulator [Niveispirillum lacus]
MRLTRYTDYGLRVLLYLGMKREGLSTIPEIAARYGISENHLTKIVHELGQLGHVRTVRGRNGGLALGRPAAEINLGALVRQLENDLSLVECFEVGNNCPITGDCRLQKVLGKALAAFLGVLDEVTLADLLAQPAGMMRMLGLGEAPTTPVA